MKILVVIAVLFLINSGIHFGIRLFFGKGPTSVPVLVFGVLYLLFAILIYVGISWIPYVALLATTVGMIGATVTIKSIPTRQERIVTIFANLIDLAVICLFVVFIW